ncbi:MAG: amidohydrolase family protein [Acidimicrobiia bacterium]
MLDLLISGGFIADGTGRAGRHGDIGIRDGVIVAVGAVDESAARTVDATDLVVAPGFVDLHTHFDVQAFWDTTLSPAPLHGITTVVGGNCGFSVAPLDHSQADYLLNMLARVEGMPVRSLEIGVPWNWTTMAEYLDALDGTLMCNTAFLVGHSAIRRAVMHDDANERHATPEELDRMLDLFRASLAAGGLGFSSTNSTSHNDHVGRPVPSRFAAPEEFVAFARATGEFEGSALEFIPQVGEMREDSMALMAEMSRVANRPLNWNVLQVTARNRDFVEHQLSASDYAAARGGRVVALTSPDSVRLRVNFDSGFTLDTLPGWPALMALPKAAKLEMMRDPAGRAEMDRLAQSIGGKQRSVAHWGAYILVETFTERYKPFEGRSIYEVAAETGKTAWDTLCDIVVADGLRTSIQTADGAQDDESWRRRVEVWRDHRALPGASDAGAHLDMIDTFTASTAMLGKAVRQRGLLPIEEAVHYLSGKPAALYGFVDRGVLRVGARADVVVIDPATMGHRPLYTRFDLPGGAGRLYAEADGIEHVFVNGVEVVRGKSFTDARPGRVLRRGVDTRSVTVHD